jgi:SMI1 / KNR4 family (SUKH-1)
VQPDTLKRLAAIYDRFDDAWARQSVSEDQIDAAATRLGVPFPADYRAFVQRFGGGHVGSVPVAGLCRWRAAAKSEWSVIELTERHRAAGWPGTDVWVVFSGDGLGNPIGFDDAGRVWLSDHDSRECVCLEVDFEDWVRRWALRAEPLREGDYLARWPWPK